MKKIFLVIFLVFLFFSLIPLESKAGVVPCGLRQDDPNQDGDQTVPCELCHIFVLFQNIINFLIVPSADNPVPIVLIIAILMIAIGGFMYMFAGGNPGIMKKAKDILQATGIALLIIYGAWIAVDTIFWMIGVADWTGLKGGWFKIKCP